MAERPVATAVQTVSAVVLVLLTSGVLTRSIASLFDPFQSYPGHVADYRIARSRAIRAALPVIANGPRKAVLVLGSSGLARAFVPAEFDDALEGPRKRYSSFNLAQLLLQPETALAMAKVIRQTYEARNKRVGITIFGISVPEMTRGAVLAARRAMPDQDYTFATEAFLAQRAHDDPVGAVDDGLELLLFGNVRPQQVGRWALDWAVAAPPPCESGMKQPPDSAEGLAALVDFCRELRVRFPRGVPAWDPATRGGFDFGLPATRPVLQRLIEAQATLPTAAPLEGARAASAIPGDIDEESVRTMVAGARELKAISDHLFVLRDVMNPDIAKAQSPERLAQWRDIATRIAREVDAPLLDFNNGTFTASDFGDRTHLNPLAAERFSSLLAARVQSVALEDRASR